MSFAQFISKLNPVPRPKAIRTLTRRKPKGKKKTLSGYHIGDVVNHPRYGTHRVTCIRRSSWWPNDFTLFCESWISLRASECRHVEEL